MIVQQSIPAIVSGVKERGFIHPRYRRQNDRTSHRVVDQLHAADVVRERCDTTVSHFIPIHQKVPDRRRRRFEFNRERSI